MFEMRLDVHNDLVAPPLVSGRILPYLAKLRGKRLTVTRIL